MKTLLSFTCFLFCYINLNGQCCAAGNPACGDESMESLKAHDAIISVDYHHSLSRDYYHGSQRQDVSFMENSYFDFVKVGINYGLHPRFSIGSEIGYFLNKTQNLNFPTGKQQIQAHGLGDLGIYFRANLLKRLYFNPNKFILSLGAIMPVGAFNEEMDGVVIPVSLQPSSGTPKYSIGLYFIHKEKESKWGWDTRYFFEYRSTINKDFLYHQYGPMMRLEAGIVYASSKKLFIKLKGKVAYHFRDFRENNIPMESSGGIFSSLSPSIYFKPTPSWGFMASFDIPLYRNVKGYQLTNLYAMKIGVRKKISWLKKPDDNH